MISKSVPLWFSSVVGLKPSGDSVSLCEGLQTPVSYTGITFLNSTCGTFSSSYTYKSMCAHSWTTDCEIDIIKCLYELYMNRKHYILICYIKKHQVNWASPALLYAGNTSTSLRRGLHRAISRMSAGTPTNGTRFILCLLQHRPTEQRQEHHKDLMYGAVLSTHL